MPTENKEFRDRRHATAAQLFGLLMQASRQEYPRMPRFMRKRLCRATVRETMANYHDGIELPGLLVLASAKLAEAREDRHS